MNTSILAFPDIKRIKLRFRLIQGSYIFILTMLFLLIAGTPYLITKDILLKHNIFLAEELIEGFLIAGLLVVGYFVSALYREDLRGYRIVIKELSSQKADAESRLNDAFKYIGALNVQIEEIQSIFASLKKYPTAKKDFKNSFRFLSERVLSIVKVDWVVFRIIDVDSLRTVSEYSETRGKTVLLKRDISNKSIVTTAMIDGCNIISSDDTNLSIKMFCIVPAEELTKTQENLIKGIVNTLEMLFIVYSSQYYRKGDVRQAVAAN
jgi:hypothetical protein